MRKLKLQVQMSIDGFISGPNGEMDWLEWNWDDALKNYVEELTEPVDCILLGRKLAEGFIPHWKSVAADPANPEHLAGVDFTEKHKIVFSKTLIKSEWENTVLAENDLQEEVARLKKQNGGDIIAYGGGTFVSSLIQQNLIDEYHLFVNPTAIGNGMTIFKGLEKNLQLNLVKVTTFQCGIAVMHYNAK